MAQPGVLRGHFERRAGLEDDRNGTVAKAVASAKEGDRDALRYLYVRYADNVYGYVRSIVREEHEAEDVTQEVFAKLMRVIPKYEDRGLPFHAWILRVARNVAVDRLRSRRLVPCEEVRGSDEREDSLQRERSVAFDEALSELPDEQRKVLYMRHVLGLSPGEIAEQMGRTEGSIHGLHHRGRETMREALCRLGSAPSVRRPARAAALAVAG